MKENKILKSLLACLMTLSVINTAVVPVSAEETEIGPETTIEETVEEQTKATVEKQAEEAVEKQAEPVVPEAAEIEVAVEEDQTFEAELDGITVSVEAPAGAFPAGTEMILSSVGNDVYEAIGETVEGKVVAAVDITFVKDGEEKQPELPIKVAMNSAEIAAVENPVVVHVDDKAAELETEIVTQMDAPALDEVAFEADSFSVYAVIEKGTTGEDARLFVHFKQANGAADIVIPVKKSDNKADSEGVNHFDQVLYDPGVGVLDGKQSFFGWTDKEEYTADDTQNGMSIAQVREAVKTKLDAGVKEGDTVTYYPMIVDVYHVTYIDEDGAVIKAVPILVKDGDSKKYTIDEDYDPKDTDSRFIGWGVASQNNDGKWVLPDPVDESKLYHKDDSVSFGAGDDDLKDDLTIKAFVPKGFWLIYKENGEGASYTGPQFYRGTGTVAPETNPTRFGYTFGGWYTDAECTTEFPFGSVLEKTSYAYAKWNPRQYAPYTVVIWTENVEGTGYDYKELVSVDNATVGQNTNVTMVGTGNNAYLRINGNTDKSYTGFHLKEDPVDVKVAPEGTTVINAYFDRTEYTFTFRANANHRFNQAVGGVSRSSDPLTDIYTVTRKYDQDISDIWAFRGSDGYTYPETNANTSWQPEGSSTYTARITALERMPAENITFVLVHTNNTKRYFHYYVEVPEGETGSRTFQNRQYNLYMDLPNDFNIVYYNDDFWTLRGFDRQTIAMSNNQVVTQLSPDTTYPWEDQYNDWGQLVRRGINYLYGGDDNHLYFYYTRQQFPITYWDGKYVDGGGVEITEGVSDHNQFHSSPKIDFDASIASYGEGGANYYAAEDQTRQGFVFGGWYADKSCTVPYVFDKMPIEGVQVYAKWILKEYRIFLYPNATDKNQTGVGTNDPSFQMGEQSTSFKIDYNETITKPSPRRDEYEINGWYTTPNFASGTAFSFDSFVANDTTVTTEYDKTEPTEKNYYGDPKSQNNKDADENRFWIDTKLELYAKWRYKLIGTDGIEVVYEAGDDGEFADGSKTFTDPLRYQDTAMAVAQGASKAINEEGAEETEKKEFKQWRLHEWNGTEFVPTDTTVLPGKTFEIKATQAQITDNETGIVVPKGEKLNKDKSYTYLIKLVAEYGSIEAPTPTHMIWYSNIKDSNGNPMTLNEFTHATTEKSKDTEGWFIEEKPIAYNKEYDIKPYNTYSYDGYVFLGWAKLNENEQSAANVKLTEKDLFLKWVPAPEGSKADGHYEAEFGDEWKTVNYVAADENKPYNAMYAVWYKIPVFKIDHSSIAKGGTGKVDTLVYVAEDSSASIAAAAKDYASKNGYDVVDATAEKEEERYLDLTERVKDNHFYGGYYKVNNSDDAYVGVDQADYWDGTKAWTTNGMKVDPKDLLNDTTITDKTYYLKEVPDEYLKPTVKYVYNTYYSNIVRKLFMVSTLDDRNYSDPGLLTVGGTVANVVHLTPSYTITASDPNKAILLSPQELIKKDGNILLWNLYEIDNEEVVPEFFKDYTDTIDGLIENFETTVSLQITTPDKVRVTRGTRKVYTNETGTVIPGFATKADMHAKKLVDYSNAEYEYVGD